ncbi:MAG TPA: PfkB family carbohydrate kinase, partial [Aminobacteriaceae bacterium]|nr:PfkB family carbohydrate kinase [Aminobacteriaceae bacterium]
DFLAPNETELEIITGMPVASTGDVLAAARSLVNEGVPKVLVTLGAKGSLLVDSKEHLFVDPFPVKPVDTTGAGDAFIGAFIVEYLGSKDIKGAMKMANRYAALSTTREGTQKSFLHRAEFDTLLEERKA